jgi:hypothetical protein
VTRTPIVNADGSTGFDVKETTEIISRWGPMTTLLVGASDETLAEFVSSSSAEIIEEVEKFTQRGSGHGIDFVIKFDLKLDRYVPVRGASYLKTPGWIVAKKCCVNVRNTDQDCFRYALTAAVDRPAHHTERPAYYNTTERRALFDLRGIEMPARCSSDTFKRFEALNRGYSLTVFECPTSS